MLIECYEMEIFTPPCHPGAEQYVARAVLQDEIAAVLPFLNATLPGAIYLPSAHALIWKQATHHYAFHAGEIVVSNLEDRAEAERELAGAIELVNRTWERRSEITPDFRSRQKLAPMAIFQLLPNINCQQCGEATCFSFALKIVTSQKQISECTPLFESPYADKLAALQALIADSAQD